MTHRLQQLALGAAILALAGCGGGGSADQPAPDQAPAAAASASPAEASSAPAAPASAAAPAADNTDTLDGAKLSALTGDAVHGKQVFVQCQACHSLQTGKNMIGPSLAGVIGRTAGSITGFSYSTANKNSGITWSEDKLFQYLEKPARVVPGTKMVFAGLPKAQDRADVIAYLKSPS
ncbi:c-type cytochrome [Novosphingobium piscinae]|uniref:Cytochrome c family protein n=1 Tax=Novosphingobium piscinae TaxID=1507448 RepID=A0A7X1KPK8_9SPHN|nr:cytochrome c family protein [Novosphingobium piscinae]MBC2668535.1 cytochrome c family protein [Novosphingobium piscinae]